MNFERLDIAFPVDPLLSELARHPELWDRDRERTISADSPHREASDIWVRFRARAELIEPRSYIEPHWGVFYPSWYVASTLQPIVWDLMAYSRATHLGGILITRLPPGGMIYPHHDRGSWHAEFHNYKVYICLTSNKGCWNWFAGEGFRMQPGECWRFNNQVEHSCENRGETDRISAIVSMRVEP